MYTSRQQKKIDEAFMECYRRLYKESTPSADFDQLMENAPLNERGQKEIPFLEYEIEHKRLEEIISEVAKEFKFKKWQADSFRFGILMGCSPKSKYESD
jgi:hypothetical protein